MRLLTGCVLFVVLILSLAVSGCAWRGTSSRDSIPFAADQNPEPPAGNSFDIPYPSELFFRELSASGRFCAGAEYSQDLPWCRSAVQNTWVRFTPGWDFGGSNTLNDLAYAMYVFSLDQYSGPAELALEWSTPPADVSDCFIGLANWQRDAWDWYSSDDLADGKYTFESMDEYIDINNTAIVTVALTGTDISLLSWLRWGGNLSPEAALSADPVSGIPPLEISLDASASADIDGTIELYEWDWDGTGDGPWDYSSNTEDQVLHTYLTGGTYEAWVRVTDDDGDCSTTSVQISLTGERGDWWMYGHDPQHTGLSPYAGPESNTIKWMFPTGAAVNSSPAIGADGTIYFGSNDENLYAVNSDGTLRWTCLVEGAIMSSPALDVDGTLYVSSLSKFYSVSSTGEINWSYETGGGTRSAAIAQDGTVYAPGYDFIYALNPDGSLKWERNQYSFLDTSPAIAPDGTVYIGSGFTLYALNPDGSLKWAHHVTGDLAGVSPVVSDDGSIYVSEVASPWKLVSISPDGNENWTFSFEESEGNGMPAIASDGSIYTATLDRNLYKINPDGSQNWKIELTTSSYSPPAIDANGVVYIGGISPAGFYAVNPDGSLKWSYATLLINGSPAIGEDGTVYVGSIDGNLYAFGPGTG